MKIKLIKIPCENKMENGKSVDFIVHEDQAKEESFEEKEIPESEIMKTVTTIANYNSAQISESKGIPGKSFIFRKILTE
jgi:hypothetical protein